MMDLVSLFMRFQQLGNDNIKKLAKMYHNSNVILMEEIPKEAAKSRKIIVKCCTCGNAFNVSYGTYLDDKAYCPKCRQAVKLVLSHPGTTIGDFEVICHQRTKYESINSYARLKCMRCGHEIMPTISSLVDRINKGDIKCKICDEEAKKKVAEERMKGRIYAKNIPSQLRAIYASIVHNDIYCHNDFKAHEIIDGKEYYPTKGVYQPWLEFGGAGAVKFYEWALKTGYYIGRNKYLHMKNIEDGYTPDNLFWSSEPALPISHKVMPDGLNICIYEKIHGISHGEALKIWRENNP